MPAPFQGGCRCGAVRYECDAEPAAVMHCHCRECQYASGGAHSTNLLVPRAALRVRGELRSYDDRAASGKIVTRCFCPTCGTPVVSEPEAVPTLRVVKAASLDDPSWIQPTANVWCEEAQPWCAMDESLPRHARMPGA